MPAKELSAEQYINGILKGDVVLLSKAITLVESTRDAHRELSAKILEGIAEHSGKSFRLGITGVPGVGKSSFIERFGKLVLEQGHKVAVLAIDPSSSKSKGSILGDKTRMNELSTHPSVYIRPSPSSGSLGGLTRNTYESMLLCEAAGYDFILIETVGVGQSETAVSGISDFFLLLMLAGAGDELQGIKRGIMEMADALVITKADGDNLSKARAARSEYAHAMHLFQAAESGWIPQSLICSSITGEGMKDILNMLNDYKNKTTLSGYFAEKRKQQQFNLFKQALDEEVLRTFYASEAVNKSIEELDLKSKSKTIQPFVMARKFVSLFLKQLK
jgi:LAO/AO transport system kinase